MSVLKGDWIEVRDLAVTCLVGVLEHEQRGVQRVEVDLGLRLDLGAAGDEDALEASLDYALAAEQVRFLAEHGRFRLLESLGLAALRLVLSPPHPLEARATVTEAWIRLAKPEVLGGNPVPVVQLWRSAEALAAGGPVAGSSGSWLLRLPMASVARRVLAPGEAWRQGPDQAALVLAGEAGGQHRGGRLARPGRRQALTAGPQGAVLVLVGHEDVGG